MDTKSITNSTRKRVRRRSHTRKIPLDGIVNMAEARREIVSALQLHRSTSTPSNESRLGPASSEQCYVSRSLISGLSPKSLSGEFSPKKRTVVSSQQYYYPLHESIPVPEPIWSTTAPAVLAVPPPGEKVEFEWPDNHSSSYTWWSSFLNSLDGKNNSFRENVLVENSMVYGQCQDGANLEAHFLDTNDQNIQFPDEWLIVPTAEDS